MFGNRLDELDNFNNTRILLTGDVIEVRSVDERFVTIHVTRTRTGGSKTFELNHPVETWEKERVESVLSAEFLQGEELYLRTDGRIAPLPPAQYGKELAERRYGS